MKTISADYNAATESGHLRLNSKASLGDIERWQLSPGDWAWLSDGEVLVGAQLAIDDRYGLVGMPDWDTVVHLDDDDSRDLGIVRNELDGLYQTPRHSNDENRRIFELLTIYDFIAPEEARETLPAAYFASRRAETLCLLGKHELALTEVQEARRLGSDDPDDLRLFLDVLRRTDLARARREAERIARTPDVPAAVLAECINVLAEYADTLPDDQFGALADEILKLAERFERAPSPGDVLQTTRALFQFNRGIVLLRLGRNDAAQHALNLARAADPAFSEIDHMMPLTVYNQHWRELAASARAKPSAA
jgi:tetratricopeptide (TPR) repeat protein